MYLPMIYLYKHICSLFLLTILMLSCVNTSNSSKEHDLLLNLYQNNKQLSIEDLKLLRGEALAVGKYVNLKFETVDGGSNYFLGYKYKDVHGDTYVGRWTVTCSEEIRKFTINEIYDWEYQMIDTLKVYIAPSLCN